MQSLVHKIVREIESILRTAFLVTINKAVMPRLPGYVPIFLYMILFGIVMILVREIIAGCIARVQNRRGNGKKHYRKVAKHIRRVNHAWTVTQGFFFGA